MAPNRLTPAIKAVSWYSLLIPLISSLLLLYIEGTWTDWIMIIVPIVVCYPLLCYGVTCVKLYDDCMTVIRPFFIFQMKKSYLYNQIDYIKETTEGHHGPNLVPGDLYVYIKGKKQPIAIPMPLSKQKQKKFKKLIESKDIKTEWGIYGCD